MLCVRITPEGPLPAAYLNGGNLQIVHLQGHLGGPVG